MKKIVLLICLILPLSINSQNWQTNNIDINTIRNATIKLTERKYLLKELSVKDSIITLKNNYINIQNSEINNYNNLLNDLNKTNDRLNNSIKNYKRQMNIVYCSGGIIIIGVIIGLICK